MWNGKMAGLKPARRRRGKTGDEAYGILQRQQQDQAKRGDENLDDIMDQGEFCAAGAEPAKFYPFSGKSSRRPQPPETEGRR